MCHVSLQLYAQYPALNCWFFSWAHFFVFSKHICSPIKPLKSSQHINHNWDFFKKILAIFQTSRIRTKSLLQVMQLQRKIYWDQLKMLLFLCMYVKSQQNSQHATGKSASTKHLICMHFALIFCLRSRGSLWPFSREGWQPNTYIWNGQIYTTV